VDDMAKKEIKVIIEGTITDNLKKDFNDRLAIALVGQYGIEGAKQILEELKAQ
jgi:CRISPR/Cas system-associated protein Cas7 (RAMP superfamily)